MKFNVYKSKSLLEVPRDEIMSYSHTIDDMYDRYYYDPELDQDHEEIEIWEYVGSYDDERGEWID